MVMAMMGLLDIDSWERGAKDNLVDYPWLRNLRQGLTASSKKKDLANRE
jgi:hypothetical protein